MTWKQWLAPITLAILYGIANPVAAQTITIEQAVTRALAHDPAIELSQANVDAAAAGIDISRSGKAITLGAIGSVGLSRTDFTMDALTQTPNSVGLKAEKTIFSSGAVEASIAGAIAASDAAQFAHLSQREKTVLNVSEAYARLWLADQILSVSQSKVKTLDLRNAEVQARFGQDLVTRTDVSLAGARLANAEAELSGNRAALTAARARLARLTGVREPKPLGFFTTTLNPTIGLDEFTLRVMDTNPNLAQARANLRAQQAKLRETKGKFGPKVTVSARASTGQDIYFFFEDRISDVGAFVTVEAPLMTGGLKSASKRRSIANLSLAQAQLRQTELHLHETATTLWNDIRAREAMLIAARRGETAAIVAAEGTGREYDVGLRTLVETLDAEDQRRDAQILRLSAEAELFIARARIHALLTELEGELLAKSK